MKAISLTQPWATLIYLGHKKIETRGWRTSYRGPLAIHATKGTQMYEICAAPFFYSALKDHAPFRRQLEISVLPKDWIKNIFPRGAIIATCELKACVRTEELISSPVYADDMTEQEKAFGDYSPGRWGWILSNIVQLPQPIPARGALSLWEWEG